MRTWLRERAVFALAVSVTLAPASLAVAQASTISQTEVRLEPSGDTGENDLFGASVAATGDTLVISGEGANSPTTPDTGAVFIFQRAHDSWVQTARLVASDARNEDDFGNAVAISEDGETVVVGADLQTPPVTPSRQRAGAVYVFRRAEQGWIQEAELTSPVPANGGGFGFWGLGISGDTIAVGDGGGPGNGFTPMVDVFTRKDATWQLTATLTVLEDPSFFPMSVAISGKTLVASSNDDTISPGGAAFVFELVDGSWVRQGTLVPADASFSSNFGFSLAVSGDRIAVGASNALGAGLNAGAAYIFSREHGVWSQEAELVALDGADGDLFGVSITLSGSTVAVGASAHATGAGAPAGSAYVYQRRDTAWSLVAELSASDGVAGGAFGSGVAVTGSTLLVGALGQHPQVDTGAGYPGGEAYVYRLEN